MCHGSGAANNNVAVCPECDGTGTRDADGGRDEVQSALPALRRDWPFEKWLSELPWRRIGLSRPDTVEVRIPPGGSGGIASARSRAKEMPVWRAGRPATFTSRFAWKIIRSSNEPATTSRCTVPLTVTEAGLGAKIEVPTIDGRAILKIPQGTAERTEVPAAG